MMELLIKAEAKEYLDPKRKILQSWERKFEVTTQSDKSSNLGKVDQDEKSRITMLYQMHKSSKHMI